MFSNIRNATPIHHFNRYQVPMTFITKFASIVFKMIYLYRLYRYYLYHITSCSVDLYYIFCKIKCLPFFKYFECICDPLMSTCVIMRRVLFLVMYYRQASRIGYI